jgi:hypothetical protein
VSYVFNKGGIQTVYANPDEYLRMVLDKGLIRSKNCAKNRSFSKENIKNFIINLVEPLR